MRYLRVSNNMTMLLTVVFTASSGFKRAVVVDGVAPEDVEKETGAAEVAGGASAKAPVEGLLIDLLMEEIMGDVDCEASVTCFVPDVVADVVLMVPEGLVVAAPVGARFDSFGLHGIDVIDIAVVVSDIDIVVERWLVLSSEVLKDIPSSASGATVVVWALTRGTPEDEADEGVDVDFFNPSILTCDSTSLDADGMKVDVFVDGWFDEIDVFVVMSSRVFTIVDRISSLSVMSPVVLDCNFV
jgi:hypothetical protein